MSAKSAATGKVTAKIKFVFPHKATPVLILQMKQYLSVMF